MTTVQCDTKSAMTNFSQLSQNQSKESCLNIGATNLPRLFNARGHITPGQALSDESANRYALRGSHSEQYRWQQSVKSSYQPRPKCASSDIMTDLHNLSLQTSGLSDSQVISNLCRAMTHLETHDFADSVIRICNHITSLALNEIDSLCLGLQKTSLNEESSITNEITLLCLQLRNLEVKDIKVIVDDLSNKLANLQFHDYAYNTFISINELLTRLSSSFLSDKLSEELSKLKIGDFSFEDQYQLTCRMLRYILTTMPAEGRVLATYMQQLRISGMLDYY